VTVDCSGVRRLGNPERLILLAARREADRNSFPLRLEHASPLLRLQRRAHRLS